MLAHGSPALRAKGHGDVGHAVLAAVLGVRPLDVQDPLMQTTKVLVATSASGWGSGNNVSTTDVAHELRELDFFDVKALQTRKD